MPPLTRRLLGWLTPPRRFAAEHLDDPSLDAAITLRSLCDITRSNTLFGGRHAALRAARAVFPTLPPHATLLDVGTGLGDLPQAVAAAAARHGVTLRTIGADANAHLAQAAQPRVTHALGANALALPLADASVDVVLCSQTLHHFDTDDAMTVLRELHRVARRQVIVCDLRRSRIAAAGFWAASFPLGFHPVTRHDGVVSVLRGFTADELHNLVFSAVGVRPAIRHSLGFRVTASWVPRS